jgi:hypothetical protein
VIRTNYEVRQDHDTTRAKIAAAQDAAILQLAETTAQLVAEQARIVGQPSPRFLPAIALGLAAAGFIAGMTALALALVLVR